MILEVNNTFDERRMYLLHQEDEQVSTHDNSQKARQFRKSWPKDFHVSPFNSRKGFYAGQFHDILQDGHLDGTITLKSSKDHVKLIARLFAEGDPLDPSTMSHLGKLKFLFGWWYVGFLTFPKIVKEAGALFFRRKLHVWYRPEPLKETISRAADATERQLEPVFRAYLRHLVARSRQNLIVTYVPCLEASEAAAPEIMQSAASGALARVSEQGPPSTSSNAQADGRHLEFRVLTPAFYTRFVHYAHDFEAIFSELRDNCTLWVSRPELLPEIFVTKKQAPTLTISSPKDFVYFSAIKKMRRLPEPIKRPLTSASAPASQRNTTNGPYHVQDVRGFRISGLDAWVLSEADLDTKRQYRAIVLRVLLSEWTAWGSIGLLWVQHMILRLGSAWVVSAGLAVA